MPQFIRICLTVVTIVAGAAANLKADEKLRADLLIVGGTESGCAAAVQAARMGVKRIVLVNDIEWLGGQFSAEGLGAIDENRAEGYDGTTPIPRSGIFREVIDAIEAKNATLYSGVKRPGNTRVITTARPVVAEAVFRELLKPLEDRGQLIRRSNFYVEAVLTDGDRIAAVEFASADGDEKLTVEAPLTIDASDWGDVIQASGAAFDVGVDAKDEYGEPRAPKVAKPANDLNPITWCMVVVEQPEEIAASQPPPGYDAANFTGIWGWIKEDFAYTSRRLVDGHGFKIDHPDVLLINNPSVDYPLDRYPADVAAALEATRPGASEKNIVAMSRREREIVFADAKRRSMHYLHYLRSKFPKFRRMALSDEFGTDDKLPPKPYIRESLRLVAQHIIKEQEVLGFEERTNYATAMFPDAVFSWQFELDFHPTKRKWLSADGDRGPWEADFRGSRRFGTGGTGRAVFPLRAMVPVKVRGLLGAQKSLGYTSVVSSSCRLHDQSMAAGQAAGAVAAVSLGRGVGPEEMWHDAGALADVWSGLLTSGRVPLVVWPFADVEPSDSGFVAVQQLALRRLLPLDAAETRFRADAPPEKRWLDELAKRVAAGGYDLGDLLQAKLKTRRSAAAAVWAQIADQTASARKRISKTDADGDGIADRDDPLPFTVGTTSW